MSSRCTPTRPAKAVSLSLYSYLLDANGNADVATLRHSHYSNTFVNHRHTLELYIDFVCPFSGKQLLGVREHLVPRIEKDLKDDLAIVIRCTPQPWHASSTFVHEAFLAVLKAEPSRAWDFAYALMQK